MTTSQVIKHEEKYRKTAPLTKPCHNYSLTYQLCRVTQVLWKLNGQKMYVLILESSPKAYAAYPFQSHATSFVTPK